MPKSNRRKAVEIAFETGSDPRTAQRWLEGGHVSRVGRYAYKHAAKKLGIELGPDHPDYEHEVEEQHVAS